MHMISLILQNNPRTESTLRSQRTLSFDDHYQWIYHTSLDQPPPSRSQVKNSGKGKEKLALKKLCISGFQVEKKMLAVRAALTFLVILRHAGASAPSSAAR